MFEADKSIGGGLPRGGAHGTPTTEVTEITEITKNSFASARCARRARWLTYVESAFIQISEERLT
jgi:hypothetical protein